MKSPWILAGVNQLVGALVQFAARDAIERHPANLEAGSSASEACSRIAGGPETRTSAAAVKVLAFLIGSLVLGAWAFGSLGSMAWWFVTGRGPGGRLLAASAVTARHYNFRNRSVTVH